MIKKILAIRLSALGDIIHAMPAIADMQRRWPDASIDIVVDERFVDIPGQQQSVRKVISLPLKRWKKNLFRLSTWREIWTHLRDLRRENYDVIVDLHGALKSALVSRIARGHRRVGFQAEYCGERAAAWFYNAPFLPGRPRPPVYRMRELAAFAVSGNEKNELSYGFRHSLDDAPQARVVFFHAASRQEKLWPETGWIELGRMLAQRGYGIVLPWGTQEEHLRSYRLQEAIGVADCAVPALMSLSKWAEQLLSVSLVLGVDSGLTHFAAALGVPCIALFTSTSARAFAPQQPQRACALGGDGVIPSCAEVVAAIDRLAVLPPVDAR